MKIKWQIFNQIQHIDIGYIICQIWVSNAYNLIFRTKSLYKVYMYTQQIVRWCRKRISTHNSSPAIFNALMLIKKRKKPTALCLKIHTILFSVHQSSHSDSDARDYYQVTRGTGGQMMDDWHVGNVYFEVCSILE